MKQSPLHSDTKCDICNMSYGEDAAWGTEDRGQFIAMLRDEVIKKRNVLFVAAAGNAGEVPIILSAAFESDARLT